MKKILSQITSQIATSNAPNNPLKNSINPSEEDSNRSKLILSLYGDLEEIREQLLQVSSCRFDLLEICPTSLNILQVKQAIPSPWILTYKKKPMQSQEEYLSHLQKLLKLEPDYLDIDQEDFAEISTKLPYSGKWIVSYHDYDGRDYDGGPTSKDSFDLLYEELSKFKAGHIKIALTPVSPSHALTLFFRAHQIQKEEGKLIFVCMGNRYSWTRVLPTKWNIGATYSALKGYERFGQLPIQDLLETYSYYSNHRKTKFYALLGDPVSRSLSHISHNQVFREFALDSLYCKIPMQEEEIHSFLELAKPIFSGFSITMPLKRAIVPREIINTIFEEHLHYSFANTDSVSAVTLLKEKNISTDDTVLILGTGSTAQAIAGELLREGWSKITLLSRTPPEKKLGRIEVEDYSTWILSNTKSYQVVINTTPPESTFSKECTQKIFASSPLFFEINCNPPKTPLLEVALEKRCSILLGVELFALQAAWQMAFWFHLDHKKREEVRFRILEIASEILFPSSELFAQSQTFPSQVCQTESTY